MAPHDMPADTTTTGHLAASPQRPPSSPPLQPRMPCASTCSPPRKPLAGHSTTSTSNNVRKSVSPAHKRALATATAGKKRVRWSTITIHEFGVALGGSAVPSKGGPAIGLAETPEFTWVTKVGKMAERSEGLHRFNSEERVRLLQSVGESDGMILRFSRETNIILTSRRRTLADADDANDTVEQDKANAKKRKADALEPRPCASYLGRVRMIPANYV